MVVMERKIKKLKARKLIKLAPKIKSLKRAIKSGKVSKKTVKKVAKKYSMTKVKKIDRIVERLIKRRSSLVSKIYHLEMITCN